MRFNCFCDLRRAASIYLLLTGLTAHAAVNDDRDAVQWLRQQAIPLQTVEAGHGFTDLQPLGKVVKDARIVELGEATHGTREFFQLKHRLIEYLASQKGFAIFSIEANMPEAYRLNDFVLHGVGDPKKLLAGLYFWTWNTEEVLDMITWMRAYNQSEKGRIEFTGFDMQTPTMSLDLVSKFVASNDPAYYSASLNPLYSELTRKNAANPNGSAFAAAKLPLESVIGKHLSLKGYIRTQDLTQGYAGLWIRADGPKGTLAFRDMNNKVSGTSPWTPYEVSIDVPANTTGLFFGAVQTGTGTAWVDSLQIDIDGIPYTDQSTFDPGFESNTARGFKTGGKEYEIALDTAVVQTGNQSLRMRRIEPVPSADANDAASIAAAKCGGVVLYLEKNRTRYLQNGTTSAQLDWIIQNARLVLEYAQMKSGERTRDESMADNVKWIADQNPGAKIIVWAHNSHVSNTRYSRLALPSMGSYLRKMYGNELVNFGFAFNEGSFQAVEIGNGLHEFTVGPAPEGSLDHTLGSVGLPIFAVDLRSLPKDGSVAHWFSQPHRSRSIGSGYSNSLEPFLWSDTSATGDFDVLLFIEKTTAARANR